jgi:hypothetical protein
MTTRPQVPDRFKHHAFGMDVRNLTHGQMLDSYVELKAHAERLAEACRRMIDSPNNFDARQKCMDAFAQWKGRK